MIHLHSCYNTNKIHVHIEAYKLIVLYSYKQNENNLHINVFYCLCLNRHKNEPTQDVRYYITARTGTLARVYVLYGFLKAFHSDFNNVSLYYKVRFANTTHTKGTTHSETL